MGEFKSKAPRTGFNRPVINMTGVLREWRDSVVVQDLVEGDIVAGKGRVIDSYPTCRGEICLEVGYPETETIFLSKTDIVKAFVRKDI